MAEAPGYWKAERALAMREVEELKHDIARYVEIASEEATRAASLEARVKRLEEILTDVQFMLDDHQSAGTITRLIRAALKDIPDATSGANESMPRSAVRVPSAPDGRAADESPSLTPERASK